ncbi:MAG: aspartate--tRNA(Asn) ligase [Candidatus Helarchaeota archaeon]|nr:aspartate--tRNA(Asn) ligase [Candidatus Helarchaeota archaeon]
MLERVFSTDLPDISEGTEVLLKGWIHQIRDLGKIKFWLLRDSEGLAQIVLVSPKKHPAWDRIKEIKQEYIVQVIGIVRHNDKAPDGVEIEFKSCEIIVKAVTPLPFSVVEQKTKANFDTRLKYRYLDLRSPKTRAIFKVRGACVQGAREWFLKNKFVEMHSPKIISAGAEGGATLFPLYYFGKEAFLAQSPQFYKQVGIQAFERVFEIAPFFRAEKSRTRRHLSESWGIDVEVAFAESKDIMEIQEGLIISMYSYVKENCQKELELHEIADLKVPKAPFPKISFEEAVEIAKSKGFEVSLEEDLSAEAERAVRENYDTHFFITEFPLTAVTFYYGPHETKPAFTHKLDLLAPGANGLELTSGGKRIIDPATLIRRAEETGIAPKSLGWYLEMFEVGGIPPHAGFGMGLDRVVMTMLNLPTVQEAVMFPRTVDILKP